MDIGYILRSTRLRINEPVRRRPALSLAGDRTLTWQELDELSNRYANSLIGLGVRPGDRVGLLLPNSADYLALYFAITSLQAVAVRINFRLGPDEIAFVVDDSEASVLIAHGTFVPVIDAIRAARRLRAIVFMHCDDEPEWAVSARLLSEGSLEPADIPRPDPRDPAMLMYTSGTTGHFKGVIWTHDATMWQAATQALRLEFNASTVALVAGPLYHVGGIETLLLSCLLVHGHGVISPSGGFDPSYLLRTMEQYGVTDGFVFSFMLNDMLKDPATESVDLSGIRTLLVGGAGGILQSATAEIARLMPQVELVLGYGMTETGVAVMTDSATGPGVDGQAVGAPLVGNEIFIAQIDGTEADEGETGEILIAGPAVVRSYWNRPADSAIVFQDGWCHSGDLGYVESGTLYLNGRIKDMVRTGGENVHPDEVERVLIAHPGVNDVAVIGVPDPKLDEAVCAFVVRQAGSTVTGEQLIVHVRERIAGYKKPRHVVFVEALPRNASGKVVKSTLREQYQSLDRSSQQERTS